MSYSQLADPGDPRLGRSRALARNWGAVVLRGVVAIIFGVVAFIVPAVTLGTLVLLWGVYAIVDGVFAIVAALRAAAHHERWMVLALEGLLGIAAGLVAFFAPLLTVVVAVTFMSAWAVVTGALLVVAAFRLHGGHGGWLLGLGGVVSVIWGVLLFLMPITAAIVLTYWLGAYALVFGIAMVAFGVRLRSRHAAHTAA